MSLRKITIISAAICALGAGSASAAMSGDGRGESKRAAVQHLIADWKPEARAAVEAMIASQGQPDEVTETSLVWTVEDRRAFADIQRAASQAEEIRYTEGRSTGEAGGR
jgi:hypothetical protein